MTENKNPCSDPSAEFERQRKRKVLLFTAILGCIFFVVLWFIFRPAPVKPQEGAIRKRPIWSAMRSLTVSWTSSDGRLMPWQPYGARQ